MLAKEQIPAAEISTSLQNFFDSSTIYAAFWPVNRFAWFTKETGYQGLEWHPTRLIAGLQMNFGLVKPREKLSIIAGHQSFRSEKTLAQALAHPNRILAVYSFLVLPERIKSLNDLQKLQQVVGRKLPMVLYPSHPGEESGTARPFAEKTFQPAPEVMKMWGIKTPQELAEKMKQFGYTGLCLDLFHFRRPGKSNLNPWQETLPKLLPHTQEIHISAGRIDMQNKGIDTLEELKDLLSGKGVSELARILGTIKELGWSGRVVTEIPASALHQLRASGGKYLSVSALIEDHRKIVATLEDLLS